MRIACILPKSASGFRHHDVADHIHMSGLLTVAGYLKTHGHEIEIFDYLADEGRTSRVIDQRLAEYGPSLLVVCAMFRLEDVAEFVCRIPITSKPNTVCFGTGALDYQACLQRIRLLDYVAPVDPEAVICELATALQRGLPASSVRGLASRDHGKISFAKREVMLPLDEVLRGQELGAFISSESSSTAYIWGSRGCWHRRCVFCNIGAASSLCKGRGWAPREVDSIVNDIERLANLGARNLHFLDAEFIGPGHLGQARAKLFAQQIAARKLDIRFFIDARVDSIQDETISALHQVGLSSVFVGVESCCQSILDRLEKGHDLQGITRALQVLRKYHVPFRIGWLVADPESSLEEISESVAGVGSLRLFDGLRVTGVGSIFHELHLHAGTPIYARACRRCGENMSLLSEIPCSYNDLRVAALVKRLQVLKGEVEVRYRWLQRRARAATSQHDGAWRSRYDYALRVVAFGGLQLLVQELQQSQQDPGSEWSPAGITGLLAKHDAYWFGRPFSEVESLSRTSTEEVVDTP